MWSTSALLGRLLYSQSSIVPHSGQFVMPLLKSSSRRWSLMRIHLVVPVRDEVGLAKVITSCWLVVVLRCACCACVSCCVSCCVASCGADRVALTVVLVVVVLCVEGLSLLYESVDDFSCVVCAEHELFTAWQCDGCVGWFGGVCVAYIHGVALSVGGGAVMYG